MIIKKGNMFDLLEYYFSPVLFLLHLYTVCMCLFTIEADCNFVHRVYVNEIMKYC